MEQLNKIALDTNMLMAIGELKIDIFEELKKIEKTEFFVPEEVINEMKKLKKTNKTKKKNIAVSEQLIKKYCKILNKGNKSADQRMQELAENGFIIATNDKKLRKKIKKKGFKTAFIRQKKVIVIE